MLPRLWVNLSPLHADLYHRLLPMNTVFGGMAIDLAAACLLCTAAFWLLERRDPEDKSLWWALVAAIAIVELCVLVLWAGILQAHLDVPLTGIAFAGVACVGGAVALWLLQRLWYQKTVRGFRAALAMVGVCVFWMLPQMVYMAMRPEAYLPSHSAHIISAARQTPHRRIIWILFDELSQDQVFDHRQADVALPELNRFRSQSVMFSDVQPAGYFTTLVVPSLISGRTIKSERSDLSGNLFIKNAGHWQRFPAEDSVFADAEREGWSTGVAGWYNPYCRIYGTWLDWCAWTFRSPIYGGYKQGKSVWWNANAPLASVEAAAMRVLRRRTVVKTNAQMHAADYDDLMRWSHELIDDEQVGFVFLHLPLPHPGGFYNRKTGRLGVSGSYVDNLALSDQSLGQLMEWVAQTRLASQTTVIVCSDHSWRVPMWRLEPGWTPEDERASGGRFDPRPVLMVHFPGETIPGAVAKPFPAIWEHDLIEDMLREPMTAEELEHWADKQ